LSPNDLVYVPDIVEDLESEKAKPNCIYKVVSFSGNQCFFVKQDIATSIVNKAEYSTLNKMERSIDGKMIKESCIKIEVDRLGNIRRRIL
jgi:CRISPR-associated endonuclease Csn1